MFCSLFDPRSWWEGGTEKVKEIGYSHSPNVSSLPALCQALCWVWCGQRLNTKHGSRGHRLTKATNKRRPEMGFEGCIGGVSPTVTSEVRVVRGSARSEGTEDEGQASGGESPVQKTPSAQAAAGCQPPPAPGPPLTTRTGSARSSQSPSDLHSAN